MRYNQVMAFLAAAECGSIRAAARRENLSQPALSQMIRRLEESLGVALLDRSVRGVRLTPYGQALRTRGNLIRAEFERARSDIVQMKGDEGGVVTIGLITSVSLLGAPRAIRAFKRRYPKVRVIIVDHFYDKALAALREGTIDFAIGPIPVDTDPQQLRCEHLYETALVPIMRKNHPKSRSKTLADLVDQQWIAPVDEGSGRTAAMFRNAGLPEPSLVYCRSLSSWLPLILENDAIMMLPRAMLHAPMLRPVLRAANVSEASRKAEYYLFTNADSPLTPAAEFLAKEFRLAVRTFSKE